jgi:hypothetical protein
MNKEFVRGVLAAAYVASDYDGSSTHEFRLDDCIAMKLNVVKRSRPRRNKKRVEDPDNALIKGMALALADVHRLSGNSTSVCEVASAAALTVKLMKSAGVDPYDWKELKRAGVPRA